MRTAAEIVASPEGQRVAGFLERGMDDDNPFPFLANDGVLGRAGLPDLDDDWLLDTSVALLATGPSPHPKQDAGDIASLGIALSALGETMAELAAAIRRENEP